MENQGHVQDKFGIGGRLTAEAVVPKEDADDVVVQGMDDVEVEDAGTAVFRDEEGEPYEADAVKIRGERENAFVNLGLQITLDRLYAQNGPPGEVSHMLVTDDATAVDATTTKIDPTDDNTVVADSVGSVSRTDQTMSASGTYTESTVTFPINKVGLANTNVDDGTGLINAIGGGGTAPFDETFTIDLTGASSFNLTLQIDVTAQAT